MKKQTYISDGSPHYNHGCTDYALWEDNGDGTATCISADSCHSCWQVGHDDRHIYAEVGEIVKIEDIPDRDYDEEAL